MCVADDDEGAWRQRGRTPGGNVADYDIEDCENDFELVCRASKQMERVLERDFGAERLPGIGYKIGQARTADGELLPPSLTESMKEILRVRNSLVHNPDINSIDDREGFLSKWRTIMSELSLELSRVIEAGQDVVNETRRKKRRLEQKKARQWRAMGMF